MNMAQSKSEIYAKVELELRRRKKQKVKLSKYSTCSILELRRHAKKDELAEKILCERSFHDFVGHAWPQIDPDPFVDEWFIEFICKGFQATYEGLLTRLNINVPPGMSKSMVGCVMFPVWLWIKNPVLGILTGSYARDNALRDAIKSRVLIETDWFQSKWGYLFRFSDDQNQKQFYKNDKFGYRQAFSILSRSVTGKRAHVMVIDDGLSASDAFSKTYREKVILTLDQVVMSRLNDPKKSVVINLGQRLHAEDPAGHFIKHGWPSIILPMEYEPDRKCVLPFGEDIRTEEGEYLTKRYDKETLDQLKKHYGAYGTAGQLQQRPSPLQGGILKLEYLRYYKELPYVKRWCWSWDMAVKTGQYNDYSVGQLWAECENGHYLVYCFRDKVEYPVLKQQVKTLYEKYRAPEVLIEDKSSGEPLIQDLRRSTAIPIISMVPGRDMPGSKEERVVMVSPLFEAGKIFVPENQLWVADIIEEWVTFPKAPHDDSVDAMSQYLSRRISQSNTTSRMVIIQ